MSALVKVSINGAMVEVDTGTTVAAAVLNAGITTFRRSCKNNEPRAPLCGMGICYACRATVDDMPHTRTCQVICRPGMRIETEGTA